MKKLVVLLLLATPSFGAVTESQVDSARSCSQALFDCSVDLMRYANNVKALFKSNFTFTIPGSTITVTIPASDRDTVIDIQKYQEKKAACAAAYGTCP